MSISAYNIGTKFNADGSVRFFPGNTIISMIDHEAPVFAAFLHIRDLLTAKPAVRCCTMLPDDSIHMTVMEGVCHQWRKPGQWTSLLPLDCKLSEVDDLLEEKLGSVRPLGAVRMRMEKLCRKSGITIRLAPVTDGDLLELRRYRDEVSAVTGLRLPNHEDYRFHISLCYFVSDPTPEEERQLAAFMSEADAYIAQSDVAFTLRPPMLVYFNDMFRFSPHRIPRNGL